MGLIYAMLKLLLRDAKYSPEVIVYQYQEVFELIFNNFKKIIFPEEWLAIDLEMSKQELLAMMLIDQHDQMIMSQLAEQINIPMSTATGIVDRLVKKGYLIRARDETDRRVVTLKLSANGKVLIESLKEKISGYLSKIYESLTEDECSYLFKIINKVIQVIQTPSKAESEAGLKQEQIHKIEIE